MVFVFVLLFICLILIPPILSCSWHLSDYLSFLGLHSLPPQIFYGVEIAGYATPGPCNASYEATPSLPGRCVWDHCYAERPSHVSSSKPLLMEGGFHSKSHETWPHSFFRLHLHLVIVPFQKNSPKA